MDVINRIALGFNNDCTHRIYFSRNGEVESMTLAELDRRAISIASHLRELGVGKGSRVGIIARNCIEWVLLDLAVLKLGGATAGLDAGRFDPTSTLERYDLRCLFVDHPTRGNASILDINQVWSWGNRVQLDGREKSFHAGYGPGEISAIKFTSGSTGPPKGMEANVGGINGSLTAVQEMFQHGSADNILVFLRLAQLQQRYWYYSALAFGHDVTVTSLDLVFSVAQTVHPTVIMGVPGFFDDVKRMLEKTPNFQLVSSHQKSKAIQALFGGRIRYLWTGSAPADHTTLNFYEESNIPLYQGYGLNETCIIAKNCPGANRTGSVGRIVPGVTVRLDDQGMLIVGSLHPIVRGYTWCSPGDNDRVFLPSGEVATHDLGYFDADQYLYILGRLDDVVVLTTGRNVLVHPIEEKIRNHRGIQHCVVYGHGKPFLTAIVAPASPSPDLRDIENHIASMNQSLFPEQQVHRLIIAGDGFTMENHLLSSQFKPRRRAICDRYAADLEAIYAEPAGVNPWRAKYGQ